MKKLDKSSIGIMFAVSFVLGLVGPVAALAAGPLPVDLMTAGNFVLLSKTGITNTGSHTSVITGDIGSSPITAAAMDNVFCSEITGVIHGVDAAYTGSGNQTCFAGNPPLANKTLVDNAVLDMGTAYTDAAGRTGPTATELGAGNIGGMTLAPGLYKWSTNVTIPTNVTLSGGANDVWIFQIAGDLSIASAGSVPAGIKVVLSGGARASNVFWQVGGVTGATLGTYSTFNGNILSAKQVIVQTGAVLNGRALAQTQVTLDANTISVPSAPAPAIFHVIKLVVNGNGGTAVPSAFNVHVKSAGVDVLGSPASGVATPGTPYSLSAGTYAVSEDANVSYVQSFTGDCDLSGNITLSPGDDKICTVVNTDIPPPAPVPPPASSGGGGGGGGGRYVPVIGVLKVPTPLALPGGPGSVTYNYTVWNVGGAQALTNVSVTDDKCPPGALLSGDTNSNNKLDPGENWKYSCTTTLSKTTTNTAVATGYSDDGYNQAAIATTLATVIVGVPSLPNTGLLPPLINIVKSPSRLTPFPVGGGNVTYTYTVTNPGMVSMNGVVVTDDKCAPVVNSFGDTNGNSLLDPGEKWVYTCQANVLSSTRNVATAKGKANGFTALGYGFSTVLVTAPGLPNTGLPPASWNIVILAGMLMLISTSIFIVLKKRRV